MDRLEREKNNREYLKRINRCIKCQKQDGYTLGGRSYCFECSTKMNELNATYRESRKEKIKQKAVIKRDYWRENGMCTHCGKILPPNYKYLHCTVCRAKKRNAQRKRRISQGVNYPRGGNGICWQCNKKLAMEGKKLCQDCYSKRIISINKAIEANRMKKEVSRVK